MRVIGAIIIGLGFLLFLGNFSGVIPTYPGVGMLVVLLGGVVVSYADRFDWLASGGDGDEWSHRGN